VWVRPVALREVQLRVYVRDQLALDVRLGAVCEGECAVLAVVERVTERLSVEVRVTVRGTLRLWVPL